MDVELHPDARDNFNKKAQDLISCIAHIKRNESEDKQKEESELYVSERITKEDIIGDMTFKLKDRLGNEHGRIFLYDDKEYGIIHEDYEDMLELSRNIQRVRELREIVSIDFVKDQLFNWLKDSFVDEANNSFVTYLLKEVKKEVIECEIWIPIPFTTIEKPFSLGKINFKTITESKIESWYKKTESADINKEELKKVKEHKKRLKKNYQGYAAGVFTCKAESIRAHQMAYDNLNDSLSILRLFTPANHTPELICGAYEYGDQMMRTKKYFTINKESESFSVSESILDKGLNFNFEKEVIDYINKGELSFYNELLNIENRNKFQEKLLEALIIYSKHTLNYKKYDKLLYILVGLETILLKNSSEPIQQNLADRIAFIIGNNAEERRGIIKTVKKIYTMRSKFIHHGKFSVENKDIIEEFMNYAWLTFSEIVKYIYDYENKQEFIKSIEELKYS